MCGEKCACRCDAEPFPGSPPRMRGKGSAVFGPAVDAGITPAYAGKSREKITEIWNSWDHPRVCGEKFNKRKPAVMESGITPAHAGKSGRYARGIPAGLGSPPHMRGKAPVRSSPVLHSGITPAHAGKRRTTRTSGQRYRDHPRTCGEKHDAITNGYSNPGSPPHMRGKVEKGHLWGRKY